MPLLQEETQLGWEQERRAPQTAEDIGLTSEQLEQIIAQAQVLPATPAPTYDSGMWTPDPDPALATATPSPIASATATLSSPTSISSASAALSTASDTSASSTDSSASSLSSTLSSTSASASPTSDKSTKPKDDSDSGFKVAYLAPIFVLIGLFLLFSIGGKIWGRTWRARKRDARRRERHAQRLATDDADDDDDDFDENEKSLSFDTDAQPTSFHVLMAGRTAPPVSRTRAGKYEAKVQSNPWWVVQMRRLVGREESDVGSYTAPPGNGGARERLRQMREERPRPTPGSGWWKSMTGSGAVGGVPRDTTAPAALWGAPPPAATPPCSLGYAGLGRPSGMGGQLRSRSKGSYKPVGDEPVSPSLTQLVAGAWRAVRGDDDLPIPDVEAAPTAPLHIAKRTQAQAHAQDSASPTKWKPVSSTPRASPGARTFSPTVLLSPGRMTTAAAFRDGIKPSWGTPTKMESALQREPTTLERKQTTLDLGRKQTVLQRAETTLERKRTAVQPSLDRAATTVSRDSTSASTKVSSADAGRNVLLARAQTMLHGPATPTRTSSKASRANHPQDLGDLVALYSESETDAESYITFSGASPPPPPMNRAAIASPPPRCTDELIFAQPPASLGATLAWVQTQEPPKRRGGVGAAQKPRSTPQQRREALDRVQSIVYRGYSNSDM